MPIDRTPNARPKVRGAMEAPYSDRGRGKSFLWYCYSPRSDTDCSFRSNLEYFHFLQVEADASVASVDYQPKAFITRVAGENIASVVDAVIKRSTGETIWREVKTEAALAAGADARAELQILAQSEMSSRLGVRHQVHTEKQLLANPMLLRNWHQALPWIAQVRDIPLEQEADQIRLLIELRGTVHFADVLALEGSRAPAVYGAAALRAVQTGAIRSDLDSRPFCKYTRLSQGGPGMRHQDIQPHQRDYQKWRLFSCADLPEIKRERFERLRKGVMYYLDTGNAGRAASVAQCSQTRLVELVARCISSAPDGMPWGFIALVSGQRLEGYTRRLKLPTGVNGARRGAAGSFNAILAQYPYIEVMMIECIKNGGGEKVRSKKPMVAAVFRVFLREVAKRFGPDQYPNNTHSKGRRSVERFVKSYQLEHLEVLGAWHGDEAAQRLNLGNGHHSFKLATMPFAVVGMDAHEIHCIGTVVIDGPGGPRPIPIERLWIDAACDEGSRAVIGYSVAIGDEVKSADLIAAVKCATVPWQRRKPRIDEYHYRKGAGLPYGAVDGLGPCRPACIKLDNATAHYAKNIQQDLRRSLGCALTWGPVATWWTNAITERFFKTLEEHGFQILQSSTGSNTQDPHRGDFVGEAAKRWIRFDDLIDLIDVLIANYNASSHKGLGGISPLEALEGHVASADMMMQRPQPPSTALSPPLGISIKRVRVRGSYEAGRRPYFELDEARYTSPVLADRFDLVGKEAMAHVDESDLRQIDLYTEAGESLGTTRPQQVHWRETKHSSALRKAINKAVRRGYIRNMQGDDPIAQYIALNAKKAYEAHNPKKPRVSKHATRAASSSHETERPVSAQPAVQEGSAEATQARPVGRMPKHLRSTDWGRY